MLDKKKSTHENMPELIPDYKIHIQIKWKRFNYIAAHNELNNILDKIPYFCL